MTIIRHRLQFSTTISAAFNVWRAKNAYLATGFLPWPDQWASLNMLVTASLVVPIPKTVTGPRSG